VCGIIGRTELCVCLFLPTCHLLAKVKAQYLFGAVGVAFRIFALIRATARKREKRNRTHNRCNSNKAQIFKKFFHPILLFYVKTIQKTHIIFNMRFLKDLFSFSIGKCV
jgi:hypothetical protein